MKEKQTTATEAASTGGIPVKPVGFLWHVTKPHKHVSFLAITFSTLAALFEVLEVYAISRLIDNFSTSADVEAQLAALTSGGILFLTLLLFRTLFWRLSGFLGIAWIIKANATSYKVLYNYIADHSHHYFINQFAGSLSNKISNAADGGSKVIDQFLWRLWPETILLIATVSVFFTLHWSVGVTTIVIVFFVILYNVWRVKKRRPFVLAYAAENSRLRGEGIDMLTNISAVRQYSQREAELDRLGLTIDQKTVKDFKQWFMGERTLVGNSVFGVATIFVMLLIVFALLSSGQATAGSLVLVLILLSRVASTFNLIGMLLNGFVRQYGEMEEGLRTVLVPHEIKDAPNAQVLEKKGGEIWWKNVNFAFEKNKVFRDFTLKIKAGERIGLVGPSGAGKTTFVSLLLRQHELASGEILIDGQNIAEVTQDSLRENMAIVPQEPMLFHRSIRENIAYGKLGATDDEIEVVAKKAQAHDFIINLPEGYNTLVGERGVKLSGGQKQRIAIARAMLKNAPILILDEATSALDSESEVAIQKALHELMEGKTVIAVAHRLSTLREMDRIIVLENGMIVEDGSHVELVGNGGTYSRLWAHQAGGFLQE